MMLRRSSWYTLALHLFYLFALPAAAGVSWLLLSPKSGGCSKEVSDYLADFNQSLASSNVTRMRDLHAEGKRHYLGHGRVISAKPTVITVDPINTYASFGGYEIIAALSKYLEDAGAGGLHNAVVYITMRHALCVLLCSLISLALASETSPTPRSYWYLDERVSRLKDYIDEVKANVVSSTYLMGQGKRDWDKEPLIIIEPFERAAWVSQNLKKFFQTDAPEEAETLKRYRLTALTTAFDFANFTSFVANDFYRPIGQNRDCGFYPENMLRDAVVPALEGTLDDLATRLDEMRHNVTDDTNKAAEQGIESLRAMCKTFDIENNLKTLENLVGPGCENSSLPIQKQLVEVAKENNMTGGNENACLQVFIAQYTQSWNATALFKDSLDKYVYLSITIQGFCYPLIGDDSPTKEKYLSKTMALVNAIRTGMDQKLDGVKLNESDTWTCEKEGTSTTESPLSSTSPLTGESVPSEQPFSTTTTVPTKRPTSYEIGKFVTDELDHAGEGFASKAWESRIGSYREMIITAVDNVKNKYNETLVGLQGSVDGIVYLPYAEDDDEQQCIRTFNDNDGDHAKEYRYKGADFFIRFTYNINAETLSTVMKELFKSKDALLYAAFSPKGGNLCERVLDAVPRFGSSANVTVTGKGGFSAIVAVKCGRQFVWYELGYRYFAAAGVSNEGYVITSGNVDSYNANCGQIMFFP